MSTTKKKAKKTTTKKPAAAYEKRAADRKRADKLIAEAEQIQSHQLGARWSDPPPWLTEMWEATNVAIARLDEAAALLTRALDAIPKPAEASEPEAVAEAVT